jgi:3-hydroxyisobutyrate dehydrogenase
MPSARAAAATLSVRYQSTDAQGHVAFIGLGNMGAHMARNLIKGGHSLSVFDLSADACASLADAGASVASSPAAAVDGATTVVTMLPSSPHVEAVYTGKDGVFETMGDGTVCIDSSTIDPAMSQKVAALTIQRGGSFVDAPVSGGVGGAEAGTLTFMVGGSEEHFATSKLVMDLMGANVVHCGDVGTGQVAKLCNNMMLGISMIGASETMNMGVKMGMDAKLLANILSTSTGRCWSLDTYNPCPGVFEGIPSSNDYKGGFGSALMLKDLGLAQDAAGSNGAATPLGAMATQIYQEMTNQGFGEKDFASAYQYLKNLK